jgi:hypothetical protein
MAGLKERIDEAWERIEKSAQRVGKRKEDIQLVAVSKTVEAERIKEAIACGIQIIGENKVQEAEEKFKEIKEKVSWHLVGHLQTNKVKKALEIFDLIHSVDGFHLAQEIDKRAKNINKVQRVLIEVKTSGEETKFGVKPEQTLELVREISRLLNVKIEGLMTIGFFTPEIEKVRPCFAKLRSLFEQIKKEKIPNVEMKYLSMGMTSDFEVAIEEGSNMVRIGTAIFGERKK